MTKSFAQLGRPSNPSPSAPTHHSSTSTLPVSKSRPGLTMARRNLCSIVQAALYFFSPSTRCSPNALAPFFCVVTHHIARNHTGKGMRVSWKIVPAVTEVWHPHAAHSHKPRTGHAFSDSQRGQRKPVGHRSRARYARHESSVAK